MVLDASRSDGHRSGLLQTYGTTSARSGIVHSRTSGAAPRRRLRRRLQHESDYSLGCESCGEAALLGSATRPSTHGSSTISSRSTLRTSGHDGLEWRCERMQPAVRHVQRRALVGDTGAPGGPCPTAAGVRRRLLRAARPLPPEHVEFVTFLGGEPFLRRRATSRDVDAGRPRIASPLPRRTNGTQWTPRMWNSSLAPVPCRRLDRRGIRIRRRIHPRRSRLRLAGADVRDTSGLRRSRQQLRRWAPAS